MRILAVLVVLLSVGCESRPYQPTPETWCVNGRTIIARDKVYTRAIGENCIEMKEAMEGSVVAIVCTGFERKTVLYRGACQAEEVR